MVEHDDRDRLCPKHFEQTGNVSNATRIESGYRVVAAYDENDEDPRPLEIFSHSPDGLSEAVEYATRLATDHGLRSSLDNEYKVSCDDFDPVVYEFHTQLREICRPTANIENVEPYPQEEIASLVGRLVGSPVDALRLISALPKWLAPWPVDAQLLKHLRHLGTEWQDRLDSAYWNEMISLLSLAAKMVRSTVDDHTTLLESLVVIESLLQAAREEANLAANRESVATGSTDK